MIVGALKLGVAAGVAYTVGGNLGEMALRAVKPTADQSTHVGAQWAGRVTSFVVFVWLLSKV